VADSIGGGGNAAYHHWKEGLTDGDESIRHISANLLTVQSAVMFSKLTHTPISVYFLSEPQLAAYAL